MTAIDNLRTHAINFLGKKVSEKIVVIESDDWGSLRMPNINTQNQLKSMGFKFDSQPYEHVDSIAREDDLSSLFEVLSKHKGADDKHPVMTAVSVVANPDFEKIKASGYNTYFYKDIRSTFNQFSKRSDSILNLWKEGMASNLFYPQFHAREHINVQSWLKDLQAGEQDNLIAFDFGIPGFFTRNAPEAGNKYARAYKIYEESDELFILNSIKEGLTIFEEVFGFKSATAMAPAYTWNDAVEKTLFENGIMCIQSAFFQNQPVAGGSNIVRRHYFGQTNKLGQHYLLRNCVFEPRQRNYDESIVGQCIKEIEIAFMHKKPASISSHRLNYIGAIHESNRKKSLVLLDKLLNEIVHRWPDVVFRNSEQIANLI